MKTCSVEFSLGVYLFGVLKLNLFVKRRCAHLYKSRDIFAVIVDFHVAEIVYKLRLYRADYLVRRTGLYLVLGYRRVGCDYVFIFPIKCGICKKVGVVQSVIVFFAEIQVVFEYVAAFPL